MISREEFDRVFGTAWHVNGKEIRDRLGYAKHAGPPTSTITPAFIGEVVFDTVNEDFFVATGLTDTDWKQLTYED